MYHIFTHTATSNIKNRTDFLAFDLFISFTISLCKVTIVFCNFLMNFYCLQEWINTINPLNINILGNMVLKGTKITNHLPTLYPFHYWSSKQLLWTIFWDCLILCNNLGGNFYSPLLNQNGLIFICKIIKTQVF